MNALTSNYIYGKPQMAALPQTHLPVELARLQNKQTQNKLTIYLILRLSPSSASTSKEVWCVGFLYEDLFERTCIRQGLWKDLVMDRDTHEWLQLFTFLILTAAAGHSCWVGLWGHWVTAQNMKIKTQKEEPGQQLPDTNVHMQVRYKNTHRTVHTAQWAEPAVMSRTW